MRRYRKAIMSFTEYFKEERDVYVQNLSNTQVSLQFGSMPNVTSALIPETRKPYNLSQYIPFKDLKNSVDLRKMLNRKPSTLILLEFEEYEKYYKDLAERNGTDMEDELVKANDEQLALMNRSAYVEKSKKDAKDADDAVDEEIKKGEKPDEELPESTQPKVVGLCVDDKISAEGMLDKLDMMVDELKRVDFEYIQANAPYKVVKKWAVEQIHKSD